MAGPDPPRDDRGRRARADGRARTRCAASPPTRRSSRRRSSARPTTTRTWRRPPAKGCRRARSTAGWRSRTSSSPPTCCARSTTRPAAYDGYVSLEVAPRLAHDTEGTLEQARMYWELVDRPNLMIKIPATDEGIPAIEEALYEGMNVNVTLLFAVSYYERVMEAFIRAIGAPARGRPPARPPLVASFFVSRVDTEVDKRLEAAGRTDLAGRAGLANARAAYLAFREVFDGERFAVAARGRVPGPAAAVGLDRGQEPGLPRDDVRLRPRRPRHRQHDAAADAHRRRPRGRGHRRDRGARPRRRTWTRCARRASTSTTSPTSCCATASTRSWCR